jgi:hypothetical protein
MENDTSLVLLRPAGLCRAGEERQHRVSNRGRPLTSHVEEKVMEFLEAIVECMRTRSAAAIAQIPFETVRNWLSKNDPAFRPDFFRAFEKARAIAVHKNIKKLNVAKDWRAAAFWLERNVPEFARKQINKNISDEPGTNNGDASVDTLIMTLSE